MSKALSGPGLSSRWPARCVGGAAGQRAAAGAPRWPPPACSAPSRWPSWRWRLPETLRAAQPARAAHRRRCSRNWGRILRHPTFLAWALLIACTYGGLFAFLAGSSFVFIDVLGSSRMACGLYIAGCSVGYIVGTFWCRRWLLRHGLAGAVQARRRLHAGRRRCRWPALAWAGVHRRPGRSLVPQCIYALRPRHPPALRPGGRGRARSRSMPARRRRWPASCWPLTAFGGRRCGWAWR